MRFLLLPLLIGVWSTPEREPVEGGITELPIPPSSKTSSTGTGAVSSNITLGEGLYDLYAASIKHTSADTIECRISYIYTTGDGSEIEVVLASGYSSQYCPLVLNRSVILTGSGYLRSTCYHLSSMAHTFNVEYRRIEGTLGVTR